MLFKDYKKIISATEAAGDVRFGYLQYACTGGLMRRISMAVMSLNSHGAKVIKLPERAINRWGDEVGVSEFRQDVFSFNDNVTDIILHSGIWRIPDAAFSGCINLKRITIPKSVKKIGPGVFADCNSLEDVYYEGTSEDWAKVEIFTSQRIVTLGDTIPGTPVCEVVTDYSRHIPGNDPLLKANIHYCCKI